MCIDFHLQALSCMLLNVITLHLQCSPSSATERKHGEACMKESTGSNSSLHFTALPYKWTFLIIIIIQTLNYALQSCDTTVTNYIIAIIRRCQTFSFTKYRKSHSCN